MDKAVQERISKLVEDTLNYQVYPSGASVVRRKDNHIWFYGSVDPVSVQTLAEQLQGAKVHIRTAFAMYDDYNPPIHLHVMSLGGWLGAGNTGLHLVENFPIDIHAHVEGFVCSAATHLIVAAKKRFIQPTASIMIHQLYGILMGKMGELREQMENTEAEMAILKAMYAKYTNIPKKDLDELLSHDIYWDVHKCVEMGLVDEIE